MNIAKDSFLKWVRKDLNELIREARIALEDFAEGSGDKALMQACAEKLRKVRGVIQMVQLYGAAQLAEEVELLACAMRDDKVEHKTDALEALMLGIVELPDYLDRLESGAPDSPLLILDMLNELRVARDEGMLTELNLFGVELELQLSEIVEMGQPNPDIPALAHRLRAKFHKGLLKLLRGLDPREGVTEVLAVTDELATNAGTGRVRDLFRAVGGLAVSIGSKSLDAGVAVKQQLGKVDREIKRLIESGEQVLVEDPPLELFKNVLYYLAQSTSDDERVVETKNAFDLSIIAPPESGYMQHAGGLNAELFDTVSDAVHEDLVKIKDELDLYIRTGNGDVDRLVDVRDPLDKLGKTLGMLGQEALKVRLMQQAEKLNMWLDTQYAPPEKDLMEIAQSILSVEAELGDVSFSDGFLDESPEEAAKRKADKEFNRLLVVTLREAAVDMAHIKEAISKYVSVGDDEQLKNAGERFNTLQGALNMLQLQEPARMLAKVASYIDKNFREAEATPNTNEINALADVITSIEYFMESVAEDLGQGENILEYTRGALDRLDQQDKAVDKAKGGIDQQQVENIVAAPPPPLDESADSETDSVQEEEIELVSVTENKAEQPQEFPKFKPNIPEPYIPEVVTELDEFEDEDEADSEILEIFLEEANEELEVIQEQVPQWLDDLSNEEALTRFRRSFHTLKGSGRLVGAEVVGEFAWSIENLLNRVIDGTVVMSDELHGIMNQSLEVLPELIECETTKKNPSVNYQELMERAFALAEGRSPEIKETVESQSIDVDNIDSQQIQDTQIIEATEKADQEVEQETTQAVANQVDESPAEKAAAIELEATLKEIFDTESRGHLKTLDDFLQTCDPKLGCILTTQVTRALHTLHGSSDMAGVTPIARITKANERYFGAIMEHQRIARQSDIDILKTTVEYTKQVLDAVNVPDAQLPDWQPHADKVMGMYHALEAEVAANTHVRSQDTTFTLADSDGLINDTLYVDSNKPEVEPPKLPDPADNLDIDYESIAIPEVELVQEDVDQGLKIEQGFEPNLPDDADSEQLKLPDIDPSLFDEEIEIVGAPSDTQDSGLVEALMDLEMADIEPVPEIQLESDKVPEKPEISSVQAVEDPSPVDQVSENQASSSQLVTDEPMETIEGLDEELLEIFLEEAQELVEGMEAALDPWLQKPDSKELCAELLRLLHTMKGASRLAGVMQIGDLSHAIESLLIAIDRGSQQPTENVLTLIRRAGDHMMGQVDSLSNGPQVASSRQLVRLLEAAQRGELEGLILAPQKGSTELAADSSEAEDKLQPVQAVEMESILMPGQEEFAIEDDKSASDEADQGTSASLSLDSGIEVLEAPPEAPSEQSPTEFNEAQTQLLPPADGGKSEKPEPGKSNQRQEQIRVRSDQLDRMVNNAGEISIYRTRLEQQNGEMSFSLNELDQTLTRLRQQLRQMEIETEAQILFRFDRDKEQHEVSEEASEEDQQADFDPLEMDRFSNIQQLSRSLAETVNDLVSIRDMMDERNRESETLLLQQSRVTNDLQDGLLRTRMVSFQQVVPRLQRLVRQTARTLKKKADLKVEGSGNDVDRSILDRIVAPLEHILRNAVSHGIEDVAERHSKKKPEMGQILLSLQREGRDVVIRITDDGGGINYQAVRKRALERGLIAKEADIADEDLVQFVLEPGFSTATSVNQVSGRGVGMDVVSSEVKQLGGALDMSSKPGQGTTFTIRLPFTLALAEALLVNIGDDVFAIPHTSIEGVTRVPRQELEACYRGEQESIVYAGNQYRVRYLGEMLEFVEPGSDYLAEQKSRWFPLLLVKHGDHRVAVHVDQMVGSRQIVVKSVGMQLSTVRWVTGGTILGDGRVALILDVNALVRLSDIQQKKRKAKQAELKQTQPAQEEKTVTVMVVDDSITVRKVTSRLLGRHSMEVVTAKDGVDAVAQLQETVPDIMLVDIEMPRMDGYELTRHVRHSSQLKHVPIIMITSRAGDKHRQRAMELGVNTYLGKPYQESQLLDNIYALLAETS